MNDRDVAKPGAWQGSPEISEEDRIRLFDMSEKFNYFLQKYNDCALNVIASVFYKDGKIQNQLTVNLSKLPPAK